MYTVHPRQHAPINIVQLHLQNLPKLPPDLSLPHPPKSVLLLTTPYYASLFTSPSASLLAAHIATLLPVKSKDCIDVLAAVVDDLPELPVDASGRTARRNEGYSWLITDREGIISQALTPTPIGQLKEVNDRGQRGDEGARENLGTVLSKDPGNDFGPLGHPIPPVVGRKSNIGDIEQKSVPLVFTFPAHRKYLTLPLANTLFQTGRSSTVARVGVRKGPDGGLIMVGSGRWERHGPGEGWDTVNRVYKVDISCEAGLQMDFGVRLPLCPLTKPRKIFSCVGNILREVQAENGETGEPASRELEQAVNTYLSSQPDHVRKQKLHIFAYITPRTSPPPPQNLGVAGINPWELHAGAKLRRVVSGGGGWGKKMGLLSLDPQGWTYALNDDEYGRLHYADDLVRESSEKEVEEFMREFEEKYFGRREDIVNRGDNPAKSDNSSKNRSAIVLPGDHIQFLVVDMDKPSPTPNVSSSFQRQHLHFGCVNPETYPLSTLDLLKAEETLMRELGGEEVSYLHGKVRKGLEVPWHFGGRSEEGIWVHQEGEAVTGDQDHVDGYAEALRGGRGKMDVPGGEISVHL